MKSRFTVPTLSQPEEDGLPPEMDAHEEAIFEDALSGHVMVRFHIYPTVLERVEDRDNKQVKCSWRVSVLVVFPKHEDETSNMLVMTSQTAAQFGDTAESIEQEYVRDLTESFIHFCKVCINKIHIKIMH